MRSTCWGGSIVMRGGAASPGTHAARSSPADVAAILRIVHNATDSNYLIQIRTIQAELPLIFQLYTVSQRAGELVRSALRGTGIRPEEAPLYSVLDRDGPLTPTVLASRLGIGPSTLSYRLKLLEAKGDIVRASNPADGRSALLELGPAARRRWHEVVPGFADALRRAERRLAIAPEDLATALDALAGAIDAELASRVPDTATGASRSVHSGVDRERPAPGGRSSS
jgi:DNA-binding MarR family transcriptional regulator